MKEIKIYVDDIGGHYRLRVFYNKALVGRLTLRKEEIGYFVDDLCRVFSEICDYEAPIRHVFKKGEITEKEYKRFEEQILYDFPRKQNGNMR